MDKNNEEKEAKMKKENFWVWYLRGVWHLLRLRWVKTPEGEALVGTLLIIATAFSLSVIFSLWWLFVFLLTPIPIAHGFKREQDENRQRGGW